MENDFGQQIFWKFVLQKTWVSKVVEKIFSHPYITFLNAEASEKLFIEIKPSIHSWSFRVTHSEYSREIQTTTQR